MTTRRFLNYCAGIILAGTATVPCQSQTDFATTNSTVDPVALPTGLVQQPQLVLLPEGFQISGRIAKLMQHPDDQRWFLKFQSDPWQPGTQDLSANRRSQSHPDRPEPNSTDPFSSPLEVLPCQWLTKMASVTGKKTDISVTFRVWSEVTTYQNKNYVLPKNVYTLSLFGVQNSDEEGTQPEQNSLPALGTATDATAGEPVTDEDNAFKLPEKLRLKLLEMPRSQPLLMQKFDQNNNMPPSATARKSFTIGGKTRDDLPENHMIVDRIGRIAYDPDDKYWLFVFESDGKSLLEPPIAILPSKLLEIVEQTLQKSSQPVKFRISGQVTRYQNKNYLLLRKVLIDLSKGNLGK